MTAKTLPYYHSSHLALLLPLHRPLLDHSTCRVRQGLRQSWQSLQHKNATFTKRWPTLCVFDTFFSWPPVILSKFLQTVSPFNVKSFAWPSKFPHSPHIWSRYFTSASICRQDTPTFTLKMIYNMLTLEQTKATFQSVEQRVFLLGNMETNWRISHAVSLGFSI